jgi:signal transduction histidine kinase
MLTAIMELLGADRGNIQIFNREHSVLTMAAHAGFQQDFLDFFREVSADDGSACGRALHSGERVVIEDVEEDAAFAPLRQVARAAGFRAVVSTPLIAADRSPLGVVSVHFHSVHRPAAQELRRLDLYIRQAADFIQRCQIDKVLRESEERFRKLSETLDAEVRAHTKELEERNNDVLRQAEQLRELSWRLLQAQEEERRHIARELHDSAGQTLTVLGMSLAQLVQKTGRKAPEFATEAEKIQEIVQQLHREIRTASYLLHPPLLDESGLSSALDWYVQGLSERSGLQITLEVAEEVDRLPGDMELLVFRLVQECLTNIHRHSGSQTALIRITRQAERVAVEVRDYGRGMSPERLAEIQSRGSGVGIRGMRERVRQFRGTLNIESGPSGTQVSISIPIPKSATPEEQKGSKPLQVAV